MTDWIHTHWSQTKRLLARKKLATEFVARMPKPSDFNPSPVRPNFDHENYDFMLTLERFIDKWKATAKEQP